LEGLIRIAQEVHQRSSQENPSSELSPQQKKRLVPTVEIGRHTAGESGHKENDQAPYFDKDQTLGMQIFAVGITIGIVVVVTSSVTLGWREERDQEAENKER